MVVVRSFPTAAAPAGVLDAVRALLDEAFDGDFSDEDWEHTVGGQHVVLIDGGAVLAHAAVVPRLLEVDGRLFRTGYVEGVATALARHGEGLGSRVMTEANAHVRRTSELGALSTGRHAFYERLGWQRWQGSTFARRAGGLARTEEDDDGVMVLRFGPSADIELVGALSCQERHGDDW